MTATLWCGGVCTAERWRRGRSLDGAKSRADVAAADAGVGVPLLEKSMKERPGYADYVRRTSSFSSSTARRLTDGRYAAGFGIAVDLVFTATRNGLIRTVTSGPMIFCVRRDGPGR